MRGGRLKLRDLITRALASPLFLFPRTVTAIAWAALRPGKNRQKRAPLCFGKSA
jgi:hypothetical protein